MVPFEGEPSDCFELNGFSISPENSVINIYPNPAYNHLGMVAIVNGETTVLPQIVSPKVLRLLAMNGFRLKDHQTLPEAVKEGFEEQVIAEMPEDLLKWHSEHPLR
jgi:hypothetical protein